MSTATALFVTSDEYLERERSAATKSEYFNGAIYAMAGGSGTHSLLSVRMAALLVAALDDTPCLVFNSDMKVSISEAGLFTYPDASIACSEPRYFDSKRDVLLNPIVIVEVLSQATEAYDRGEKFRHYRTLESLRAYVLVSQWSHHVEVYSREAGQSHWSYSDATGLDAVVSIPTINVTLSLAEIYKKIELSPRPLYVVTP